MGLLTILLGLSIGPALRTSGLYSVSGFFNSTIITMGHIITRSFKIDLSQGPFVGTLQKRTSDPPKWLQFLFENSNEPILGLLVHVYRK
ncbi:Cohesin subunit SA-1 [Sesbania bispinosa]|nr:Cohesin subunit SA-1 [Sesbania bispinosa]